MWQFRSQAPPPDNERIRKVIEEMLGVLGHEIVGRASTATAAVAEARTTFPDVVLMGVKLDGVGDGIDAAYSIKNRLGIRSLLLTGTTDSATRARSVLAAPSTTCANRSRCGTWQSPLGAFVAAWIRPPAVSLHRPT
jgi:CheY-like chemotaxis protein